MYESRGEGILSDLRHFIYLIFDKKIFDEKLLLTATSAKSRGDIQLLYSNNHLQYYYLQCTVEPRYPDTLRTRKKCRHKQSAAESEKHMFKKSCIF